MAFKPDMIFISAGFDAHRKDLINSGYIALVEEDFDWVTANLVRVANSCCEGRVVSALEEGTRQGVSSAPPSPSRSKCTLLLLSAVWPTPQSTARRRPTASAL